MPAGEVRPLPSGPFNVIPLDRVPGTLTPIVVGPDGAINDSGKVITLPAPIEFPGGTASSRPLLPVAQ